MPISAIKDNSLFFRRSKSYSRTEILETAGKAQLKRKTNKAIAGYLSVLKKDPDDYVVHGKVAPLLAKKKRFGEAWSSFQAAGNGYTLGGFRDKALGIYVQATHCMPMEIEAWKAVAKIQLNRGLKVDSVNTLLKAHRHFRRRALRPAAIYLLRKARKTIPWHFEVTFELTRLLAKVGKKEEALQLLRELATREERRNLRRTRGAIFKISPGPGSAWRWLRAAVAGT